MIEIIASNRIMIDEEQKTDRIMQRDSSILSANRTRLLEDGSKAGASNRLCLCEKYGFYVQRFNI